MASKNINLPNFQTFDLTEITTIGTRWKKYVKRFEILYNALAITDDKQKVSMLLNYVGEEVFDIYENILPPGEHSYKDVTEALDKHFTPKVNHSYETYIFRSMKQFVDESVQQFYIRLKAQGAKCNFTDINRELKQQIELNTINNKLRRFSFRNPEKSLEDLLTEAKSI